jgi:hypothetical protein
MRANASILSILHFKKYLGFICGHRAKNSGILSHSFNKEAKKAF